MACLISGGSPAALELFVFKYSILHLPTPTLIWHFPAHTRTGVWDSVVSPLGLTFHFSPKKRSALCRLPAPPELPLLEDLLKLQTRSPILISGASGGHSPPRKCLASLPAACSFLLLAPCPGGAPYMTEALWEPEGVCHRSLLNSSRSPMLWGSGPLCF